MLEFAGEPVIDRSEANLRDVSEFTPSLKEYVGAAWSAGMAGNPVLGRVSQIQTLRSLDVGPSYYTDEFGQQQRVDIGLDPADPRARRLSLDEANEKGAELGFRFSDPPTQGQFDFLADLKRQQNAHAETLSHASTLSVRNALGLTAELAASAVDPLNVATAFVPVVREARYARMVAALGRPLARVTKGFAEGAVGTALITPALAYGARQVHQDYGFGDALRDTVIGGFLGSGLHWAGGTIKDIATGKMRADIADLYRRVDPGERWAEAMRRTDRREGARVSEGENASRHDQLDPKQRAQVINAAVRSLETDQMPKIDALFASEPKLRDMAIPDRRFPATVKLRSDLTAEDYVTGGRGASIIDMAISRSLGAAKQPATPQGLFANFTKRFKALASNFKLETVAPGEFFQRAGAALEHPDQRAVIEPGTKTILTTEGATLGAVRHEIERALDEVQKIQGDARGGYRYRKNDLDLINAHRAAMAELVDEFPDRLQGRQASQQEAVDAFSKQDEPILNYRGKEASDAATELVNRDKDQKLERMIADEEIGAIEDIISNIQGNARDLGIMDKVIPAEERIILDESAARQGKSDQVRDLFSLIDHIVDEELVGKSASDAELLLRAGPEKLADLITGRKSTDQVIAETAARRDTPAHGIEAWHVSPHDITKFDEKQVGSGEGNRYFGEGFYFGRNTKTRDRYAGLFKGRGQTANAYKIKLDLKEEDLLDWEKPFSQQSESVKSALRKAGVDIDRFSGARAIDLIEGLEDFKRRQIGTRISELRAIIAKGFDQSAINELRQLDAEISRIYAGGGIVSPKDPAGIAKSLKEAGVPGIQYVEAKGEPALVIFDTSKIFITEKNGRKLDAPIARVNEDGLVTRVNASKDINAYLKSRKQELSVEALERAIRDVQAGEDINVAIDAALRGGELLAKADQAAAAPAPAVADLKAPGEQSIDDMFNDIVEEAKAIIDAEKIYDKRDLVKGESQIVREEHAALEANAKTRDLFSAVERDEFNEADRERALRQGDAVAEGGAGAGAGRAGPGAAAATELQTAALGRDGEAARGAGAAAEREGASPGGERSAPDTAVSYGASTIIRRVITPDSSIEISVEPKIVELADLIHAEGDLQVRDRSRKESAIEARNRATRLDPEQLLPGRVADAGAPIVYPNGDGTYTILSGNGRTLSLRHVYGDPTFGSVATRYRERLGPAADGYRQPVLVSSITDQLSHEAQVQFAERANRSRIATMSATERAQRDADVAGADIMTMYQGGDFTARDNQPFVRAFMLKAVTDAERGEMSKNGQLTKSGVDRLTGAVLAAAYDDTSVLSLMLESTDNNIKSIASAYRDVAPFFARLRAEIAQGLVREEMDITPFLMEAARFVQKVRDENIKIASALSQIDALHPMDPVVDRLIRQFYNPQLTRANSSLRIAENLRLYAETARQKRVGGFFEDTTTSLDVMGVAERQSANALDETLLAPDEENLGRGVEIAGREAPQSAPAEPGAVAGERGAGGRQEAADRSAAQAEPAAGLRAQLEVLTVPAIRERAKAEGVAIKGRKKSDIIDSYVKASEKPTVKKSFDEMTDAEIRLREMEGLSNLKKDRTQEEMYFQAAWSDTAERFFQATEYDRAFGERNFTGEARETFEHLMGAMKGVITAVRNADRSAALYNLKIAGELATDLKLKTGNAGAAKLFTQWVDSAIGHHVEPLAAQTPKAEMPKSMGARPSRRREQGVVAPTPEHTAVADPLRTAFYDFLEGSEPVRGAGTLAKKLGVDEETAYRLLDDAEARGWLKLKDNGTYIRVPADRRPLRPDFEQEFSDVGANQLPPEAGAAVGGRGQTGAEGASRLSAEPGRATPGLREKLSGTERFDVPGFTGVVTATPDVRGRPARIYRLYPEGVKVERNKAPLKSLGEPLIAARVAQHADGRWEVIFVDARPEAQGQRISQKLYDAMETDLGQKMRPSGVLTEEGFSRIWLKRDPEAVKYHRFIQSEDVYLSPRQMIENLDHIDRALKSKGLAPEARIDNELRRAEIRQALDALPPEAKTPEALAESFSDAPRGWGRVEPDFEAQLQSAMTIQRAIGTAAHRLPEGVRVEVVDAIQFGTGTASGSTLSRLLPHKGLVEMMIRIARTTADAVNTFNHEIFHTMRLARVINRFEWKVIRDEAAKAGGISPERLQRYKPYFAERAERLDLHPDLDRHFIEDKLVEEWAATKFGEWASKRTSERETFLGRIFGRIKDFIDDLRQSFTNLGRLAQGMETKPSLDQIFRSIEDGSMAKRYRDWGLGRAGADNPLSVNRQAGNEFAAFLNQDMRKIASDSSEAEGRAVEMALANLAPCASHHL